MRVYRSDETAAALDLVHASSASGPPLEILRSIWRTIRFPLSWGVLAVLLAGAAIVRPIDHDESQYVAATALAATMVVYRDFAYLQTPLQPLLMSPLATLFPGKLFLALRLVNAAAGLILLMLVYAAQRKLLVTRRTALAVTALLACCEPLLFASAVARNDALPAAFFALALLMLVGPPRRDTSFVAGLALAAAAAAKISYALPLAALALLPWLQRYRGREALHWRWAAGGAALGLAPVLVLAAGAPSAFLFEVLRFPVAGPAQWYRAVGEGWRLGPWRYADFLSALALGPALPLLGFAMLKNHRRASHEATRGDEALDLMLLAGFAAALLPNPIWRQYLVPVLPPLFIRAGMTFDRHRPSAPVCAAILAFAAAGLVPTIGAAAEALSSGSVPLVVAEREAQRIGGWLRGHHVEGRIAGLAPHLYVDSGYPLDPRFAAGPFLFRTRHLLSAGEVRRFHIATQDALSAGRVSIAPEVLVSGGEGRQFAGGPDLDVTLVRFARSHGYRAYPLDRRVTLFLRTAQAAVPPHGQAAERPSR